MVIHNFSQFLEAAAGRGFWFNIAYIIIFFTALVLGLLAYSRDKKSGPVTDLQEIVLGEQE